MRIGRERPPAGPLGNRNASGRKEGAEGERRFRGDRRVGEVEAGRRKRGRDGISSPFTSEFV